MLNGLRKTVFLGAAVAVLAIVGVNQSVRTFGDGYPHLLSPYHLENKVSALTRLGIHYLQHPFMKEDRSVRELLRMHARENRLPESLVLAVAQAESNFLPHRISSTGAMGIMQLMPYTAKDMGVDDPFNPTDNIRGGTKYLRYLWNRYRGNLEKIAAAYNWGPGRVSKHKRLRSLPNETRHYVKRVLQLEKRFRQRASR